MDTGKVQVTSLRTRSWEVAELEARPAMTQIYAPSVAIHRLDVVSVLLSILLRNLQSAQNLVHMNTIKTVSPVMTGLCMSQSPWKAGFPGDFSYIIF